MDPAIRDVLRQMHEQVAIGIGYDIIKHVKSVIISSTDPRNGIPAAASRARPLPCPPLRIPEILRAGRFFSHRCEHNRNHWLHHPRWSPGILPEGTIANLCRRGKQGMKAATENIIKIPVGE